MKRGVLSSVLVLVLAFSLACVEKSESGEYEVLRVIDGDTVKILFDGESESVRLIGIDTPEMNYQTGKAEPFAKEAKQYAEEFIGEENVRLEFDKDERDRYGRLLAYVYVGDSMLNEALLSEGLAFVLKVPPNDRWWDRFDDLSREAKIKKRGLWKK